MKVACKHVTSMPALDHQCLQCLRHVFINLLRMGAFCPRLQKLWVELLSESMSWMSKQASLQGEQSWRKETALVMEHNRAMHAELLRQCKPVNLHAEKCGKDCERAKLQGRIARLPTAARISSGLLGPISALATVHETWPMH
jgi:hypothetical protein